MTMTPPTTETGIVKLLPCPFCGGDGEMVNDGDDAGPRVNCCGCDMEGPRAYWVDYLSMSIASLEAVRQWNTRAAMPDSTQLLQTMAGALEAVAKAERDYRVALLTHGNGSDGSELAWKAMKRAGDAAREVIAQFRAQEQRS